MLSELNQTQSCRNAGVLDGLVLDCYLAAIKNVAHYAIELEDDITAPYRRYVNALADDVSKATPEALQESRATLRALLREYRDRASQYLNQLRSELNNSANALHEILQTLSQTEGDHEIRLSHALKTLRELANTPPGDSLPPALREAADSIETSLGELRKQHQLTVSQFLCEIHMLHKRIEALENAAAVDKLSDLFNPSDTERRIRSAQSGASILALRIDGLRSAGQEYGADVALELTAAFTRRLRNSITPAAELGRCGSEAFVAILPFERDEAVSAAKWVSEHLSGQYACLQAGKTVRPAIVVHAFVIDRPPGEGAEPALVQLREHFAAPCCSPTSAIADPHR